MDNSRQDMSGSTTTVILPSRSSHFNGGGTKVKSKVLEYDQCSRRTKKGKGVRRQVWVLKRVVRLDLVEKVNFGQR